MRLLLLTKFLSILKLAYTMCDMIVMNWIAHKKATIQIGEIDLSLRMPQVYNISL